MGTQKAVTNSAMHSPFNSPLEVGLRSLILLVESYPNGINLERLVAYDYLVIHTGDVCGPPSLHPALPLRTGELTVRRQSIQQGLDLMRNHGLIISIPSETGFLYVADDSSGAFISAFTSPYVAKLCERARWLIDVFGQMQDIELHARMRELYQLETWRFQPYERLMGSKK